MGYLVHILLAFGALALAEAGFESGWRMPLAAAALVPVPHLFARRVRAWSLSGAFARAERGARLLAVLAPLLHLATVTLFGWLDAAQSWSATLGLPALEELELGLGLVPYVVYELLVIDARARISDPRPAALASARRFQARMLLSGLVPLVVYLLLSGLVLADREIRVHVEGIALVHAGVTALLLVLFGTLLPFVLRATWETVPIERGPQRAVLEATAAHAGFRCRSLLMWRTGYQMANAAIVGFFPWHRVVLFTDALLAELEPRQLAAVFGHEIGHARRHHVAVFAAWSLAFFLGAHLVFTASGVETALASGLGAAACIALWYVGFGYLSRRFELDADLCALELVGDPEPLVGALERVGGFHGRSRSSWRHFSTDGRRLFLRAVAFDPEIGRRLRRDLRRWSSAGLVLFALTLVLELVQLGSSWSADRVRVDLQLGRYAAAAARAGADPEIDPELARLAQRGAELEDGTDEHALERRARAALEAGDLDAAGYWVVLAVLRGGEELAPVAEAFALADSGDLDLAREAFVAAGGGWSELLAPWLSEPEPGD